MFPTFFLCGMFCKKNIKKTHEMALLTTLNEVMGNR